MPRSPAWKTQRQRVGGRGAASRDLAERLAHGRVSRGWLRPASTEAKGAAVWPLVVTRNCWAPGRRRSWAQSWKAPPPDAHGTQPLPPHGPRLMSHLVRQAVPPSVPPWAPLTAPRLTFHHGTFQAFIWGCVCHLSELSAGHRALFSALFHTAKAGLGPRRMLSLLR